MQGQHLRDHLVVFLRGIGLRVEYEKFSASTFLPGIDVRDGGLVIDADALRHQCDLLHTTGHLAVIEPAQRRNLNGSVVVEIAELIEVAAIAWSYAAIVDLGIDVAQLFHPESYGGRGVTLLEEGGLTTVRRDGTADSCCPAMRARLAA